MPGKRSPDRVSFTIFWPRSVLGRWKEVCREAGVPVSVATIALVERELAERGERVRAEEPAPVQ